MHYCGQMNIICQFCHFRNFLADQPSNGKYNTCNQKGRVKFPKPFDVDGNNLYYPKFLKELLTNKEIPEFTNFRENIRPYLWEIKL